MLTVLFKKNITPKIVLAVLVFFFLLHLSGHYMLGTEAEESVLDYYQLNYRHFYLIAKHISPILLFLFLFVFKIDMTESYTGLLIMRQGNQYKHLLDISCYIALVGAVYWLLYFQVFYLLSGTSHMLSLREMIRLIVIIAQTSSLYFCLSRVFRNAQTAALISCATVVYLSMQSQGMADWLTLSPVPLMVIVTNLLFIIIDITKKGVLHL
ncbi:MULTISPECIES: lantibiotic ABC transporter permease [unclassified Streptococcus]|uniref:lantibiotic ABC transporter permease n=1 Tax=unclassified Streptococcus TaxID=2608887 RepID=UPI00359CD608